MLQKKFDIPASVTLIAVTKTQPLDKIEGVYYQGVRHFGENYLNEALLKIQNCSLPDIQWHYIGQIQTKKCKKLAQYFDWVQTITDEHIAKTLNDCNQTLGKKQNVLIQVKVLPDEQKGGIALKDCPKLIDTIQQLPHLRLRGLMTILPLGLSPEEQYKAFLRLRIFFNKNNTSMDTISMGMSDDYTQAIQAGSNMIRIGRAIFGERN